MDNDFINLQQDIKPELIEVTTEKKLTPKRVTVIYELNTSNQGISEEVKKDKLEDLSR